MAALGAASETTTTAFSGWKISAGTGSPAIAACCTCVGGEELVPVAGVVAGGWAFAYLGIGLASFAGALESFGATLESGGGGLALPFTRSGPPAGSAGFAS